ncbi:hypothetical protein [Polyangium spumosum]|uniref:Uncharacterized protein n=1 Tax=Polyangium spumosum TaxID=889282 RepID=A0A6N7PQB5_9BACT|nr:hypothetical protein [Polyangium spumosum]MRG92284.1 hypothetical protein [Polyangium spumosum]
MEELFRNDLVIVTREPGIIRVRRTTLPVIQTLNSGDIDALVSEFRIKVPLRERKNVGMLLDTRDAPMVLDDATMEPIRPLLNEVLMGFARHAILVKTAVGKLQATRRSREEANHRSATVTVFDDEAAALVFLRGEEPAAPPSRSSKR